MAIDEDILRMKNAQIAAAQQAHSEENVEKELKQSIYDASVDIFGVPTVFAERTLLDGKISMRVPDDLIELEADVVRAVYPLGNPPQVVMGNEAFHFMLGFNHTRHEIPEAQVKEFPKLARAMMEKCGPKVTITHSGAMELGGRQVAALSFVSQTVTEAMYNMMFYSNVEGRLLIGFVNFRFKDRKRLEPLIKEMIASYRILEDCGGTAT